MKIIHRKNLNTQSETFFSSCSLFEVASKVFHIQSKQWSRMQNDFAWRIEKKSNKKTANTFRKKEPNHFPYWREKVRCEKKNLFHFCALVSFVLILTFVDSHTLAISTFVPHVCILHPNKLTQNFLFVLFWFFCFRHWAFVCEVSLI